MFTLSFKNIIKICCILFLLLILILPSLIDFLSITPYGNTLECKKTYFPLLNSYNLKSTEISIYPGIGNIKCLGSLNPNNEIIKSQRFYTLLKTLSFSILLIPFKKDYYFKYGFFGLISILISFRYNPDFSYWMLLKEYLLIVIFFELHHKTNLSNKLDDLSRIFYFFICTLVTIFLFFFGWKEVWKYLGIPSLSPTLLDLNIIATSTQSYLSGFNPYLENPFDAKDRLFSYPKIWLSIGEFLQLSEDINFYLFGFLMIIFFLAIVYFLIHKYKSFYILVFFLSFPSFGAIERGQTDLLIFILIFFALYSKPIFQYLILSITVVLKFYPILVFSKFIKKDITSIFKIGSIFLYMLFKYSEIELITKNLKTQYLNSFGLNSTYMVFSNLIVDDYLIFLSTTFIAMFFCYSYLKKSNDNFASLVSINLEKKIDSLFFAGISLYVGLFLVTSSYDYRLIFLFFCIPYLIKKKNSLSNLILGLIILASQTDLFLFHFGYYGAILNTLFKFALFILLISIIIDYFYKHLIFNSKYVKNFMKPI